MSSIFGSIFSSLTSGGSAMVGFLAVLALTAVFIYVVILFWVFIPAIVVERAGVIDCFKRSLALTKGRRWAILGVLAVVFVANLAVSLLIKLLVNIAPMASVLLDVLAMLFFMALSAVLAAVGYTFLRAEKEGVAIDDVVTVFD
jgi:hypothetical protein